MKKLIALIFLVFSFVAQPSTAVEALKQGSIILFRHANAPGVGDPPNFQVSDCSTQRNLDEVGRLQAKRIGEYLQANGVKVQRVITSQWCRCKETAALAFSKLTADARQENPAFNSFFNDRQDEPKQTESAKALLMEWKGPGTLIVVTHQVNITALTSIFPQSGEGIVLQKQGNQLKVVGRITP
jgi:phosphohistidine phosphatase SixA